MWKQIAKYFNKYPKRRKIAQKMIEYGLKIKEIPTNGIVSKLI